VSPAPIFRPAAAEDEEFLFALYCSTRAPELEALPGGAEERATLLRLQFRAQRLHYQAQFPNAQHLIVLDEGQPAGRLLTDRTDEEIRIIDIALMPGARNRGIGSQIICEVLAEAALSGRPVRLRVWKHNPAARLYRRLGFQVTGDDGVHLQMEWRAG